MKIPRVCRQALDIILHAIEILADHSLSDDAKQQAFKKTSFSLALKLCHILLRTGAAAGAAALPFWLGDYFDIVPVSESMAFSLRIDVLFLTAAFFIALWLVGRRFAVFARMPETPGALPYSRMDRIIHNLAFGSKRLLKIMTGLETKLYSQKWADITVEQPVFITSLPRAGTTVLLEALSRLPNTATHTYRDMPFVLTPVLWSKISGNFRVYSGARERAHGDGLNINEDSPEAFEEVLWSRFFVHKYKDNKIALWRKSDGSFFEYFSNHIKKIILLRRPNSTQTARYISKNNANIARIPALREMFPDAHILIPVRDPVEHAISLLRQHNNFLEKHTYEPFTKKYMFDIGHFEFGSLHSQIQFESLDVHIRDLNPETLDYWIAYWISAFEHLKRAEGVTFVSYERLMASGIDGFRKLAEHVHFELSDNEIEDAIAVFRQPTLKKEQEFPLPADLINEAANLHRELMELSIV